MTRLGFNDVQMIAGSAVLCGIGSEISGGNFWQGFGVGIAVGAFNHALHSTIEGGPGDPKHPKEIFEKANQIADATGLPIEIIMASYEYSLKYGPSVLSTEGKIMAGISALGKSIGFVGLSAQFGVTLTERSTFNYLKTVGTVLTTITRINPYFRIAWGIAEVTGMTDPIYREASGVIENTPANLRYSSNALKYGPLNVSTLYK